MDIRINLRKTILLLLTVLLLTAGISGTGTVYAASGDPGKTMSSADSSTYTVNGVVLPLKETGYRPGDYRGGGLCWDYARHIYYKIWNCFFYHFAGTEDDMLRDYPSGKARRITADNARLFLSAAEVGAVIRLQSRLEGPDNTSGNRHSLILIDKTETGCTVYHDWRGISSVTTYTWEEFEKQFCKDIDFGYFKYIKYPGAKALRPEYSARSMEKELLISSRLQVTAELSVKKR